MRSADASAKGTSVEMGLFAGYWLLENLRYRTIMPSECSITSSTNVEPVRIPSP